MKNLEFAAISRKNDTINHPQKIIIKIYVKNSNYKHVLLLKIELRLRKLHL